MKMKNPEFNVIYFSAEDVIATSGGPLYCTNSGPHYHVTSVTDRKIDGYSFAYYYDEERNSPYIIPDTIEEHAWPSSLFYDPATEGSYYTPGSNSKMYLCENQNHGQ